MASVRIGLALALVSALLSLPSAAEEQALETGIPACASRNLPQPDSVRALRITARDPRAGSKTVIVVKMYGRRDPDGQRQLLMRFIQPEDVRGVSLLLLERESDTDVYLASPELPDPRKITAADRSNQLFGTDLSYEDFAWLRGLQVPGESRRLADETVSRRPAYVVEIRPEESAYGRVVSYVDKESCLPLRINFYARSGRLSKELTTDQRSHLKHGDVWVAHDVLMRDARDLTTTHLLVDSHEQDVLLPDGLFSLEGLRRAVRPEGGAAGEP
jgi:hypothetical protein